jgi:hypothetical protein
MTHMVKIQNRTTRVLELQAPHAVVCKALGRCLCHRGGGWAVLRIMPHGTQGATQAVDAAWLLAPDVKAALLRRAILVHGAPLSASNTAPAGAPDTKAARRRGAKE